MPIPGYPGQSSGSSSSFGLVVLLVAMDTVIADPWRSAGIAVALPVGVMAWRLMGVEALGGLAMFAVLGLAA